MRIGASWDYNASLHFNGRRSQDARLMILTNCSKMLHRLLIFLAAWILIGLMSSVSIAQKNAVAEKESESRMQPAVTAALIGAAIAIIGWYATYALTKHKEDRTRRIEIQVKYRQRQIEELYGPLVSLIEQIFNVFKVRENILGTHDAYSEQQLEQVRQYVWKNYFHPLHQEIGSLLRTKLYLLEGGRTPASLAEYLEHATQEELQHRLWDDLQLDTSPAEPREFPNDFYRDIKETLQRLMNEYQRGLADLRR